jgi:hypothetical protein
MFDLLLLLLVLWVVLAVVAALVTGAFWLALVGAGLFLLAAGVAGVRSLGPTNR